MRIMGLDFGAKTVGVALSDELLLTASALEVIRRKDADKLRKTCARIEEIVKAYDVSEIVVGLPLHMDMRMSGMAESAMRFRDMIGRRTGLKTVMWDERLTSVEAREILRLNGVQKENEKEVIDMVAAKVILESYLEHRRLADTKQTEETDAKDYIPSGG